MRISDWSSDVCSSDLVVFGIRAHVIHVFFIAGQGGQAANRHAAVVHEVDASTLALGRRLQAVTQQLQAHDARTSRLVARLPRHALISELLLDGGHVALHDVTDLVVRRASRSEEHTSELQSLMRISYAVFCLKK